MLTCARTESRHHRGRGQVERRLTSSRKSYLLSSGLQPRRGLWTSVKTSRRVIRDRDERMTAPRQEHVLLSSDAETVTHVSLTSGQEQNLFEEYVNGVCLDELEIAAGPS